jgi:hypothetical protein
MQYNNSTVNQSIIDEWGNSSSKNNTFKENYFYDVMGAIGGVFVAVFQNSSLNSSVCYGNGSSLVYTSIDLGDNFKNISQPENISNVIEDFGDILKTTYPLTYSCYYGALEINNTFWGYVGTF